MITSILASGSKGNCTYIETNHTKSLIDIGMTCLYVERNLKDLGIDPKEIDSVFITHTHVDHIAGLKVFIKKYNPIVYLTSIMYEELKYYVNNYIILEDNIVIGDLEVEIFNTSHDADDSVGYIFKSADKEIVYLTDTGYLNRKHFKKLANKDMYIFESNHDVFMLMNNDKYPRHILQRIQGDRGHLSNEQCSKYLCKDLIGNKTKNIVLIHLSENNNTKELALETLRTNLDKRKHNIKQVIITDQNTKTELIEV